MPETKGPKDAEEYKKSPYGFQRPLDAITLRERLQAGEAIGVRVAWFTLHNFVFRFFISKADGRNQIGTKINRQDHGNLEGKGKFCC